MADYGFTVLMALVGLTWIIGGWLQWLTLRRQERLIRQLEQQSEAWCRRTIQSEDDPWLPADDRAERARYDERNANRLVRPSSWKGF